MGPCQADPRALRLPRLHRAGRVLPAAAVALHESVGHEPARPCSSTSPPPGSWSVKVLLPGASVLARVVAGVRDRASARSGSGGAKPLSPEQREELEALLLAGEDRQRQTRLEQLRRSPTPSNAGSLVSALERVHDAPRILDGFRLHETSRAPPSPPWRLPGGGRPANSITPLRALRSRRDGQQRGCSHLHQ
jgi:hypothetical protein